MEEPLPACGHCQRGQGTSQRAASSNICRSADARCGVGVCDCMGACARACARDGVPAAQRMEDARLACTSNKWQHAL